MEDPEAVDERARDVAEIARVFFALGCRSFGGPVAHIAYFRSELVERKKWMSDARFADTVALCQFLPGPASSQVVFAVGMRRAGLVGALVASACFTAPSVALMLAFAFAASRLGDLRRHGFVHGLAVAAVAVVAQAVLAMGKKLCVDRTTALVSLLSAIALLVWPGAGTQLAVLAGGALVGLVAYRSGAIPGPRAAAPPEAKRYPRGAVVALAVFFALLVVLPFAAAATGHPVVRLVDLFYRSGALVFGGGHVVLPLLRERTVASGLVGDDRFLAGYGAAQALPGPMFAFAAFLGASIGEGPLAIVWGLGCTLAIFLPAWLLVGGVLPFWERLRASPRVGGALVGANAAVVGVLLAALYDPVFREGIRAPRDLVAALVAFALLETWKAPPWLVVGALALVAELAGR